MNKRVRMISLEIKIKYVHIIEVYSKPPQMYINDAIIVKQSPIN